MTASVVRAFLFLWQQRGYKTGCQKNRTLQPRSGIIPYAVPVLTKWEQKEGGHVLRRKET